MEDFAAIFRKLPHLDLTGQIEDIEPVASGLGPSCEVFKGHWKDGKKTVAVKRLRVFLKKEKRVVKKLAREVYIWSKLKHKNVLPLLGCFLEGDEFPNLVSEWMVKGTLYDYMPNLPRGVWTVEMACGIAEGLAYLHDNCVVHADLKSPNVLLSRTLEPLLADFGVSHILTGSMSQMCGTSMMNLKGTSRWMAVELLATDSEMIPDEKSDVWAFGMVLYELLERTLPFNHLKTDQQIILAISKGQVPESPSSKDRKDLPLSERGLWDICGDCWRKKPELRPSMSEILSDIGEYVTPPIRNSK
ncbi:kinase-like protein [Schizopora paradoxa]|uniref:Kinase-like protein n=1 Tax=Schizopora paradoxa TaxID=27342 RepID=A0A0H2RLU3_9AGAM|nr:kinase-like protein [Schizopora paradoxa]